MKTFSSLFFTRPCSSPFGMTALAMAAFTFLMIRPVKAEVITGFETSEGFEASQTAAGKAGWTINGTSSSYLVTNQRAYVGSQSLQVVKGNAGSLNSPLLYNDDLSGLSLWISNPDSTFSSSAALARFRMVIGNESSAQSVLEFYLNYDATENSNYVLTYRNGTTSTSTSKKSFSDTLFDPHQWNEFRFQMDLDTSTYSVSIGGTEVVSGIPFYGAVTGDSRIYQIQFWGHPNNSTVGDAYYDHITGFAAVPEPTSTVLLGGSALAGLLMLARRRKVAA